MSGSVTGVRLLLDHAYQVALVLGLLALCAALGRLTLARVRALPAGALATLSFSTALGAGIVATCVLLLGALGALRPLPLAGLLAAGALLARRELAALPALLRAATKRLRPHGSEPLHVFALGVTVVIGLFLLAYALAPPSDWDSLMYHVHVPVQFLEDGRVHVPEDNLHVAFVQLVHFLYVPLLAFGGASAPAVWSVATALLLGFAAFGLAERHLGRPTASWTLALVWGSSILLPVAMTARVDVTLAWFLLLAHWALLNAASGERRLFLVSAALLGLGFGVKYHGGGYALALAPVVLWVARRRAGSAVRALRDGTLYGALALAAAAPWLLKNALLLQAPLYPFFTDPRLEPWLARLYGSSDLPAGVTQGALNALQHARDPLDLVGLFLMPGRLTVEVEGIFYFLSPLLLLLPLWVLHRRHSALNALLVPGLGYALVLLLFTTQTNTRYLIPVVAPLSLVATHLAVTTARSALGRTTRHMTLALVAALALTPAAFTLAARFTRVNPLPHLLGWVSGADYLHRHPDPEVSLHVRVAEHVRDWVGDEGRVLMLLEARGLYFESEVLQDNRLTNWPFLAPRVGGGNCLAGSGITHVLVSETALAYYAHRGLPPSHLAWDEFRPFADRCLLRITGLYGFSLYALRP